MSRAYYALLRLGMTPDDLPKMRVDLLEAIRRANADLMESLQ